MSIFGSSNTGGGNIFGSSNTQQQGTGGLFGKHKTRPTQPSLFGGGTGSTAGSNMFGAANTNTNATQGATGGGLFGGGQTGGGLFINTANQTQQQGTTGGGGTGLFGGTNTQPATGGTGLFGGSTTQPATGGTGLFGNTTTQPAAGTGLFGSTTQNQPTGGLFGNSNQTQQTGTTGLFGGNTNQQAGTTGGLFGNTTQGTSNTGGLFGNNQQQQQQGTTGGGLFGGTSGAGTGLFGGPKPAGSLFGNTTGGTNNTTQQQQQQPSGGLFGNTNQQQPAAGGLFGGNTQQQPAAGGLFGSTNQQRPGGFGTSMLGTSALGQPNNYGAMLPPGTLLTTRSGAASSQRQEDPAVQTLKLQQQIETVYASWSPTSPICRFQHPFYNLVEPTQVNLYGRPPNALNDAVWDKAVKENPDPSCYRYWLDDLRERVEAQSRQADNHQQKIKDLKARIENLKTQHAVSNASRLQRAHAQQVQLMQRLVAFVQHLHLLIPAIKEELRGKLEEIEDDVKRGRVKGKLNELWALLGAVNASIERRGSGAGWEWAVISQVLGEQQILQKDMKDLGVITGNSTISPEELHGDPDLWSSTSTLRASALR
ncbi:nucleoporin complex subunit 54-domain-containing protein [Cyathus striatus]|nr:nucleoporin complex subunit 54-domain-containing protein [Cyathus striatus]